MIHTKKELLILMHRFLKDEKRGISHALFADLAGINMSKMREVFLYRSLPLTEYYQIRVSRAFQEYQAGRVQVMVDRNNVRSVEYRKPGEEKPRLVRSMGLQLTKDGIKMKVGVRNRADYSQPTLDEQFKGK